MTGEAGFAQDIPAQELDNIKNSGKADIRQDDSNRVCQIGFNLNKKPFDNVKVRQAIKLCCRQGRDH